MENYQKGPVVGEGTYGSVICATHKPTGRQVAIKKVRMCSNKEGINVSVLRELKALKALQSPHVVDLLDVFNTKNSLVLVFEYMEWSLEDVIRDKSQPLSAADVKAYMQMLLQALAFVHGQQVAHRDIKPDNMLIGSNGVLKLADFGLARSLDSSTDSSKLTPQVFGRWYRPPELIMGCAHYGSSVDMWAAGCVLAELLLRRPWFPGVCDMDQLDRIFKVLGVPTVHSWPGMADLPHRIDFKPADGQPLQQVFPQASADCLDLLQQLMQYDPQQRITAAAALAHPYFSSSPAPTAAACMPRPVSSRGGRRSAAMVPALMHDMLVRPDMLLRQQHNGHSSDSLLAAAAGGGGGGSGMQGQLGVDSSSNAGSGANNSNNGGSSRHLFAFSGQSASFSGRFLGGQATQPMGGAPDGFLGLSNGSSRLGKAGASCSGLEGFGSDPQQGLGAAGYSGVMDEGPSLPWKGRLSFGSALDQAAAPVLDQQQQQQQGSSAAAPGAGSVMHRVFGPGGVGNGEGSTLDAAAEQASNQQQQQPHKRPSPVPQQGSNKGSMRPPLHRTSAGTAGHTAAAAAAAGSGATPLPARPGSAGASAMGSGDTHAPAAAAGAGAAGAGAGTAGTAAAAAGGRRRVSDLSAALSSAAAAGSGAGGLLGGLLVPAGSSIQQQQEAVLLQQHPSAVDTTPAAGIVAVSRCGKGTAATAAGAEAARAAAGPADSTEDADMACPMSLGTSAHKRSRAVFEAAAGAAGAQGIAAAPASTEQQQQHACETGMAVDGSRRLVRGRRSSMGSGCCSMETDGTHDCAPPSTGGVTGAAALGGGTSSNQQQQQQQQCLGGMGEPAGSHHVNSSSSSQGQAVAAGKQHELVGAVAGQQQQQQPGAQQQQQQPGAQQQQQQLLGSQPSGSHSDNVNAAFQLLHPWPLGSAAVTAAAARGQDIPAAAGPSAGGAGSGGAAGVSAAAAAGSFCCAELSQQPDADAIPDCSGHMLSGSKGSGAAPHSTGNTSCCPMSLDQRAATGHQHQHYTNGQGASECMKSAGCSSRGHLGGGSGPLGGLGGGLGGLDTGGGCGVDGLAAMDPTDLAELANWWRPRLDSAERAYLRNRKQQMDEALLQASQQDDDYDGGEIPDRNTLNSPDFHPRVGALFGSPLDGGSAGAAAAGACCAAAGCGDDYDQQAAGLLNAGAGAAAAVFGSAAAGAGAAGFEGGVGGVVGPLSQQAAAAAGSGLDGEAPLSSGREHVSSRAVTAV